MGILSLTNSIARVLNKYVMTLLAIIISITLFSGLNSLIVGSLWLLFIVFSGIFSINGFFLFATFKRQAKQYTKSGRPVRGLSGFEELEDGIKGSMIQSFGVTASSIFSFLFYLITINVPNILKFLESVGVNKDTQNQIQKLDIINLGSAFAVALVFLAIWVMFLVEYPEEPAFTPGGLIGFYEPDNFPLFLDNLLSDVFSTYMDPATRLKYDEWSNNILEMVKQHGEFETDENDKTRLERAREKILLLAYLEYSDLKVFSPKIVEKEIAELFGEDKVKYFKKGKLGSQVENSIGDNDLSWKEVKKILKYIEKQAPEPFRLIDRILLNLVDNYEEFTDNDLYFTIASKSNQGSVKESTGIIAFFLNMTRRSNRIINVKMTTDENSIHPSQMIVQLLLDPFTDPFPEKQPSLVSKNEDQSEDIIGLLTDILQVGDAVWFRIQPRGFGYRVVSIYAREDRKGEENPRIFGRNLEVRFTKSLSWYVKTFAPKLSALGSVAIPILNSIFG